MTTDPSPPALATTKRKFHKLLDNLAGSASTTSLASTLTESRNTSTTSLARPTVPEPVSKRSRLSDVSMEQQHNMSGNDRIKALQDKLFTSRSEGDSRLGEAGMRVVGTRDSPAPQPTPSGELRKEPNFQPFSQEQFLARLKTFADVKKWTSKPDSIGEVEWAKRGWICETWNTVACKGGCEARLAIRLRPKRKNASGKEIELSEDMTEEIDDELVARYQEKIVEGHHEECLWRKAGCKDDIYHIPIPNRAKSTAELLERYRSFKPISADLPLLKNIMYPDPSVADVVKRLPPVFFSLPDSDTPHDPPTSDSELVAFAFALFGWSGVSESKIAIASCGHCFQRNGLWLAQDTRLQEMSKKLDVPAESLRLNLVEAHREHCPWKNPDTQGNSKDGPIANMAAWQTLEFLLLGSPKTRPENKSVESVDHGVYRDSFDSDDGGSADEKSRRRETDNLSEKWNRFKAKLRRTASKKSLRSMKSMKSSKSVKSVKSMGEKDKEN